MRRLSHLLLGQTALLALGAVPAFAQTATPAPDASVVIVDQVSLNDVWSDMEVVVTDNATSATSVSTAIGNTSTANVLSGDVDYDAVQNQNGAVLATNRLTGGTVYGGTATAVTTAYGNAAQSGTWDGNTFHTAYQTSTADVTGATAVILDGADSVSVATTSAANVASYANEYGYSAGFNQQASAANVTATTDASLCCNNEHASFAATATGNAISGKGYTTTSFNGAVQTTAPATRIRSSSAVYSQSATNLTSAATSAGNSIAIHNEFGYATLGRLGSEVFQGNEAQVDATSIVTLDNWFGTANSTAYGVGNSALISNVGSDTQLYANQENFGEVYSTSTFTGSSTAGGAGYVTATSIGNAATGTVCVTCGDAAITGVARQNNAANIYAAGTASVGNSGHIYGAATAVGNSATYQSVGTD